MPNVALVLKAEIARISRLEIKEHLISLHDSMVALKKTVSELKYRTAVLESDNKRLLSLQKTVQELKPQTPQEIKGKVRLSSKGIRKLRTKLGLSQSAFADLLGVTSQAVYSMENKEGKLRLRPATLLNLLEVRKMGKREARKRIEEVSQKK